jgi:hypothetical protein
MNITSINIESNSLKITYTPSNDNNDNNDNTLFTLVYDVHKLSNDTILTNWRKLNHENSNIQFQLIKYDNTNIDHLIKYDFIDMPVLFKEYDNKIIKQSTNLHIYHNMELFISDNLEKQIIPLIIEFYCYEDSQYNATFTQIFNELSNIYHHFYTFNIIDYDKRPSLYKGIQSIPIICIKDKHYVIDKHIGHITENQFHLFLLKNMNLNCTLVVHELCEYSKKIIPIFKNLQLKYRDLFHYEIIDCTFKATFDLDLTINSFPSLYIHTNDTIIINNTGYLNTIELEEWLIHK